MKEEKLNLILLLPHPTPREEARVQKPLLVLRLVRRSPVEATAQHHEGIARLHLRVKGLVLSRGALGVIPQVGTRNESRCPVFFGALLAGHEQPDPGIPADLVRRDGAVIAVVNGVVPM